MNAVPVFLHDTKVFDPEWPYLMTILSCIGMTKPFIKLIRLLYNNPINKLYINSQISLSIPIGCGTHHGCSLSTILFAPALDPLAAKFRQKYLQYSSRFMDDPYWPHSVDCGWYKTVPQKHSRQSQSHNAGNHHIWKFVRSDNEVNQQYSPSLRRP